MKKLAIATIRLYQKTLSPDHGALKHRHPYGYCRYYPTCSEYSIRAIEKFGLFKGFFKGLWRVVRCNPLSSGGIDKP